MKLDINFDSQDINYNVSNPNAQLNGVYGIISNDSNLTINNNQLIYGESELLNINNSKTILLNNEYYSQQCIISRKYNISTYYY